ncbi:MAG: hypothetical protein ACREBR_05685 [bacterium]
MSRTIIDPSLTPLASMGYQNIPNILDNGGFEIWQRGASFSTLTAGTYTTDRWKIFNSGTTPTGTITQETTTTDLSSSAMKINLTNVTSNGSWGMTNNIENYQCYLGKTITITARINANATGGMVLFISDGILTANSIVTANAIYTTYTLTFTPSLSATQLYVGFGNVFGPVTSTGTWYLDNFMLAVGSTAIPFVPTNPQQDLARCQRYFQVASNNSATGGAFGTTQVHLGWSFKVTMRVVPTITFGSFSINLLEPNTNFSASSPNIIGAIGTDGVAFIATIAGGTNGAGASLASGTISASADL